MSSWEMTTNNDNLPAAATPPNHHSVQSEQIYALFLSTNDMLGKCIASQELPVSSMCSKRLLYLFNVVYIAQRNWYICHLCMTKLNRELILTTLLQFWGRANSYCTDETANYITGKLFQIIIGIRWHLGTFMHHKSSSNIIVVLFSDVSAFMRKKYRQNL